MGKENIKEPLTHFHIAEFSYYNDSEAFQKQKIRLIKQN